LKKLRGQTLSELQNYNQNIQTDSKRLKDKIDIRLGDDYKKMCEFYTSLIDVRFSPFY